MQPKGTRTSFLIALTAALVVVGLRFFTPYELQDTDQGKQAQYALDVYQNGNWMAPGCLGEPATKPPLYTWLAAIASLIAGRIDETTIRVPTALAAIGLVLVTWDVGRRLAGPAAGAAAAVVLATSHHFAEVSGVVRTDGLLAFLIAAQVLVHVRTMGERDTRLATVLASSAIAAAACLTKGPAGFLGCAAVALHLAMSGGARRILRSALIPAALALCVFVAWYYVAAMARPGVTASMYDNELKRHMTEEGLPNPLYYVIHTPLRVAPWTLLIVPALWLAVRDIRRRHTAPVAPLTAVAMSWFVVVLATFSFFPHQRPDLIYPAEPALALLVGALVVREFPAWAPSRVAVVLGAIAAVIVSGIADPVLPPDAPRWVVWMTAALVASGAALAFAARRRDAALACFGSLALAGVAGVVLDTLGEAPSVERISYEQFARTARRSAEERGAHLVAVGVKRPAPLFDLGLTEKAPDPEALTKMARPFLVVSPPSALSRVEDAAGPLEILASHVTGDGSTTPLVLVVAK